MSGVTAPPAPEFGHIKASSELGKMIRAFRKRQNLTLETVSGLSNLSIQFLSELERGKETAELGKVLEALNKLGLELIVQPHGQFNPLNDDMNCLHCGSSNFYTYSNTTNLGC